MKYKNLKNLYQQALEGNPDAQYTIGISFNTSDNIGKDLKKSFYWLEKAAIQEHSMAQYTIGVMYGFGVGVRKDLKKAKYWFKKSCDNGNETACSFLKN